MMHWHWLKSKLIHRLFYNLFWCLSYMWDPCSQTWTELNKVKSRQCQTKSTEWNSNQCWFQFFLLMLVLPAVLVFTTFVILLVFGAILIDLLLFLLLMPWFVVVLTIATLFCIVFQSVTWKDSILFNICCEGLLIVPLAILENICRHILSLCIGFLSNRELSLNGSYWSSKLLSSASYLLSFNLILFHILLNLRLEVLLRKIWNWIVT